MSTIKRFPVVMVGGPPNSGKSVFVRALTDQLRDKKRAHYVLRAAPDGEGDWTNAISEDHAKWLRQKGEFTPNFLDRLEDYLSKPEFPLIVDVGGRPTAEQAQIFRHCTHAILLTAYPGKIIPEKQIDERYETARDFWLNIFEDQQIQLLCDLKSDLNGDEAYEIKAGVLTGTISGLDRNAAVSSTTLDGVVNHVEELFRVTSDQIEHEIKAAAPVQPFLNLEQILREIQAAPSRFWLPEDILKLRETVAGSKGLSIYGRAPIWVYATLANMIDSGAGYLFDARLGWIKTPTLTQLSIKKIQGTQVQTGWRVGLKGNAARQILSIETESQYLDINDMDYLPVPAEIDTGRPLLISGKLPNWLWAGLVSHLGKESVGILAYQPQLEGAVVVSSADGSLSIGTVVPIDKTEL